MKYVFWTIAIFITVVWLYFVFSNLTSLGGITLLDNAPAAILGMSPKRLTVNMGILILAVYILGSWAAIFFVKPFLMKVSNDESNARVKVLENKIQVLEKALEDALKKNK